VSQPRWPVVLFDLDGTLADTIALILGSYAHATRTVLGRAASEQESREWIGMTLADTFGAKYPGKADELMAAYFDWNLAHLDTMVEPYAGVHELLRDLDAAGVRTGVVTSKRRASAERTLHVVGLTDLVELIGTMEDTDRHKPAPDPLLRALDAVGRAPQEVVYVGDAIFDLQAARAAGLDAVGVTWGAGAREALDAERPHALVDDVDALRAVLLGSA
jgi:pyrophosphatase PpaX